MQELVFGDRKVKTVIGELLKERLSGKQFDPITGTQVCPPTACCSAWIVHHES